VAAAHLGAIAPHGGVVFVGLVDEHRSFALPAELEDALDHAASVVAQHRDCFVTPGLFERDRDGALRRDRNHVRGARVAWCDIDAWDDDRDARYVALRTALGGEGVFRVQSSAGRYHVYVALSDQVAPETVAELNQQLVAVLGGDPAPAHAAAWMRLAGTVHQPKAKDKSDPARGAPSLVCFTDRPGDGRVSVAELGRVLDELGVAPSADERAARHRLEGMRDGDGRNDAMARYAGHVAIRCRDDRKAYDGALAAANELFAEPLPKNELQAIAKSIWKREHANAAPHHGGGRPSQSTLLVHLAGGRYTLYRNKHDDSPVAVACGSSIGRSFRCNSEALRAELSAAFFCRYGKTPTSSALKDALTNLEGLALEAPVVPFALRVGQADDGALYVDLGQEPERFVRVASTGWEVVTESPVMFLRTNLTAGQVIPTHGGSLDELRSFFHLSDDNWILCLGWLVSTFLPDIPHPVAYHAGERGTGKSTAAGYCVALVDPVRVERRTSPRDQKDWAALIRAAWVTCLDNLSGIPMWLSDALCCVVTGGGTPFRRLYTDDDLHVINIKRPVVISGIDLGALRDDLADRMLHIQHEVIPADQRRSEQELNDAWQEALPRNLGAVLDLLVAVLAELAHVELDSAPRMADFARVLKAIDLVLDTNALEFYARQSDELDARALEADQVATTIQEMLQKMPNGFWEGTAQELLKKLNTIVERGDRDKDWPKSARSVGQRITRSAPLLRKAGIETTFRRSNGARLIGLQRLRMPTAPGDHRD
jgi:hypothetical protein